MKRPSPRRANSAGVTLLELLIAVTLLSLLSVGIVITLRVALSAMDKTGSRLTANRRVVSVERILEQEIGGIMPVVADCRARPDAAATPLLFFQGEAASLRLASTYSLQQGARGLPMILEFQVIPGENGQGVRLVVNEHWYTGPREAGQFCLGLGPDPLTGQLAPRFAPIQIGADSFVLADKLAYCRFSYRELPLAPLPPRWVTLWTRPVLPNALRIDLAPLALDAGRLQPISLSIPIRVTRIPMETYEE